MKKYSLEITEQHVPALLKALEFYTRFKMGQFHIIFEDFHELSWDDRQSIHRYIRQFVFSDMHPNASLGVFSPELSEDAKISHDIRQAIEYIYSWDMAGKTPGKDRRNFNDMTGVRFDEPMKCSDTNLPVMKKVTDDD